MDKVEYLETTVPNAYHGTSRANAENIEKTGFRISRKPELFLGDGVYFYKGSKTLAESWAKGKYPEEEIATIVANIKLGYCLDLTIPEHRELLSEAIVEFKRRPNWRKVTDTFVLNYFAGVIEPQIDTIVHFREPEKIVKLFAGSQILTGGYMVICVRKTECILSFSIAS